MALGGDFVTPLKFEEKAAAWQKAQGWQIKDPFIHLTTAETFVGLDDLLGKVRQFVTLGKKYGVLYGHYGFGKTIFLKKICSELSKTGDFNVVLFEEAPEREYVSARVKTLCAGKLWRKLTFRSLDDFDYPAINRLVRKRTILVFDEAHYLDDHVHSYVRSLVENGNTFSAIFAGKPEITKPKEPGKPGIPGYLVDRLDFVEGLRPLSETEAVSLVKKRVEALGLSRNYLFTDEAVKLIAQKTHYVPRSLLEWCSRFVEFAIKRDLHELTDELIDREFGLAMGANEAATPQVISGPKPTHITQPIEKTQTILQKTYSAERDKFLRELSPLQVRIAEFLYRNEPKTASQIAFGIGDSYDTVRHMIRRLQGKYGEIEARPTIAALFPIVEETEALQKRGKAYRLSSQARKTMALD